ncbi:hypothetical protein HMPREF0290_2800 [Corynebacterium efficiens YS-314]|nr:hypothetical protein HMPREF0290_2800 [Corynebacterium efficiens YS-314]
MPLAQEMIVLPGTQESLLIMGSDDPVVGGRRRSMWASMSAVGRGRF